MIELYEFPLSGNCHKVRLMLSLLGLDYRSRLVKGAEREHKEAAFLRMNPFGQVPVLVDEEVTLRDSQAILIYLARKQGGVDWLPEEPADLAEVMMWLFTAANEIARGPSTARVHRKFGADVDYDAALTISGNGMGIVEQQLKDHDWLALDRPTLADIACYPYLALAHEGGIDMTAYPAMQNWFARIEKLPGYVSMPGM